MKNPVPNKVEWYKYSLFLLVPLVMSLFAVMTLFSPPVTDINGCPSEEFISKKNIAIIDITDPVPETSKANISQLLTYSASEQTYKDDNRELSSSMSLWFDSGKQVEKTTFYILSTINPSELVPIGQFCRKPPSFLTSLTDSELNIQKSTRLINEKIESALLNINNKDVATKSLIIQTIATVTNSTNWRSGSVLYLVSDLEEISNDCGNFSKHVSPFKNIPHNCKKWIDMAKNNMSKDQNKLSEVRFCEIIRDRPKVDGLREFWKEFRHYTTLQKSISINGCPE